MSRARRIWNLVRGDRHTRDIDRELAFHLAELVDDLVAAGMHEAEARRVARRRFGNYSLQQERTRDMDVATRLEFIARDLKIAVRGLRRSPAFTIVAVAVLALGIGANMAVFSVLNGVLLRALPYSDPARLVMIFDNYPQQGEERGPGGIADFLDWKARSHSFQSLDAFAYNRYTLTGDGEAEQIPGMGVTATFFETLGARPLAGRTFAAGEDRPGAAPTVVISERLWRRRYASNPSVLGRTLMLNGRACTVIGIMPAGFRFLQRQGEVWTAMTLNPPARRGPFFLQGLARLKPGVSLGRAAADMKAVAEQVERENPRDYTRLNFPVVGLRESMVGDVRSMLWIAGGGVTLVLLIAVSNVASLMLARATARRREIAVRLSIGAGRAHLVSQLMAESVVLALAGGGLGVALAAWTVSLLHRFAPPGLPRVDEIAVDGRVLAFTLLVSIASAMVFGLAPALASARASLGDALKQGGRAGEGRHQRRARSLLVVAQVTFSVLLLIGAGLLMRSFDLLGRVDPGFQAPPGRVLTMQVSPGGARYREPPALRGYWDRLLEQVRAIPGVEAASLAISMPPNRVAFTDGYEIENKPAPPGTDFPAVTVPIVSADYFRSLGIPLLRGRGFDQRDRADSPLVTIISQAMARRHFGEEDPVGKRFKHGGRMLKNPYMEIVGVVGDVRYDGPASEAGPAYYEPLSQSPARPLWLIVRTQGEAAAMASPVRHAIRELDADVPVAQVTTMRDALAASLAIPRFRSLLMAVFAAASLLLAAIGIYGVISYSVAQRMPELGVRVALGATSGSLLRLVVGQGSRLALLGIALGVVCALAVTRVLRGMLFAVSPTDGLTFGVVAVLLGTVALLASLIPARRAARVDPVTALRAE